MRYLHYPDEKMAPDQAYDELELAALLAAIRSADVEAVRAILKRRPALARANVPSERDREQTVLHAAIPSDGCSPSREQIQIVRLLLGAGADPNALGWGANNGYCPPLTMAAWGGHVKIVDALLSAGANPDGDPAHAGKIPIDTAAEHGHSEAVDALIVGGAGFELSHLLKAGLYCRARDILQWSPGAARYHRPDADPPIHAAVKSGSSRMVDLLMEHGARIGSRDRVGRTALHVAIEERQEDIAQVLLRRGAREDIYAATGLGDSARVKQLLSANRSRAKASQIDGMTPLHYAAWGGDVRSAQLLLDAGADVSPRARRLWACLTPLHAAIQQGHHELMALLIQRGADLDAFDPAPGSYWPTPLHAAARWGTLQDVEMLLDAGADPNGGQPVPDTLDPGPLSWAILSNNMSLVRLLLARGLDRRLERFSDLLQQAERGSEEMLELLRGKTVSAVFRLPDHGTLL